MSAAIKPQTRINNPQTIDTDYILEQFEAGDKVTVQFSDKTYNSKVLAQLNELCGKYDTDFEVRFWGHRFDFKTLLKIPNVKALHIDCMNNADNVQAIGKLQNLQKLLLSVFELKETEILNTENLKNLKELTVGETTTKPLNLEYLKNYKKLEYLMLVSQTKNIEAVGELPELEHLSFRSLKKTPVPFVTKLKKLKTLKFILGGRENIHEIGENEIENLELTWVRGFNDISNISVFKKLKTLLIQDNIQLGAVNFDKKLPYLNDVKILNCKTLSSLTGLENLPALHQLRIYKTALDFQKFNKQKLPKNLKIFAFYTTSKKTDQTIKETIEKKGYRFSDKILY